MAAVTLDVFTTITKIEVIGGVLVLECKTGVGGTQTGVPQMQISGLPGVLGARSVFSGAPIAVGKSVLVQPQGLKLTNQTGQVFLFCNLNAIRAQMPGKQPKTVQFKIITPAGQSIPPVFRNYYWLAWSSSPAFIPTLNPLFPIPGPSFGFNIESIWADDFNTVNSADIVIAAAGVAHISHPGGSLYSISEGGLQININTTNPPAQIDPSVNVFLQQTELENNPSLQPSLLFVTKAAFMDQPPDSTAWVLRAGVWKKKTEVILPPGGGDIPAPIPAVQPTSFASTGGGPPSKTITVTVTPPPANTVSIA